MPCKFWISVYFILNIIFIYNAYLIKNKLDLYACLAQVKLALEIEYNICKISNKEKWLSKMLICIWLHIIRTLEYIYMI